MQWSDGEPATSADVCYSWGLAHGRRSTTSRASAPATSIRGCPTPASRRSSAPTTSTFIAYTEDQSDRIFQTYVPILPEHIYGELDYEQIAEQKFDAPLVGTGPYTMAEWKTGQFARFVRNPNYWGTPGLRGRGRPAVLPRRHRHDGPGPQVGRPRLRPQRQPGPVQGARRPTRPSPPVEGAANGWTQLAFNTYGTGTGKTIEDGGPSTKALLDPAFRDALGYAVDKRRPRRARARRLRRHGQRPTSRRSCPTGTSSPTTPRTFDIELAKQKLDAARVRPRRRRASGSTRRATRSPSALVHPNTQRHYSEVGAVRAGVVRASSGIDVSLQSLDSDTLDEPGPAAGGGPARQGGLRHRAVGLVREPGSELPAVDLPAATQIGSLVGQPVLQPGVRRALRQAARPRPATSAQATLAEMQNLIYDEAPYDILFYDSNLDVYRNDRFAGWQNMPGERHPVLHLRHPELHAADRRVGPAVARARRLAVRRVGRRGRVRSPGGPARRPATSVDASGTEHRARSSRCSRCVGRRRRGRAPVAPASSAARRRRRDE